MNGKSDYRRFIKPDRISTQCKQNEHWRCWSLRCNCDCHKRKEK